ncbi:MAG: TlpA disulfide reductase family protein [Dokdonella sp.]
MRLLPALFLIIMFAFSGTAEARLEWGDVPPDSLGVDKDKREVKISDYRGKVVVLTFWATWCGYCLKELPVLENVQRKLGPDRVAVVAINTDTDQDKYRAMRRKMKDFQLTMTVDRGNPDVSAAYGVSGLPHMLMIDKQGKVAFTHIGYSDEMLPRIVDEINELLEE